MFIPKRSEYDNVEKLQIKEKLRNINLPNTPGENLFNESEIFSKEGTNLWRGECSSAELIIRPISPEDETTKKDATKVVLSLLLMFGIVETCSEDTDLENDLSKIQLSERDQYRILILVGDGLSQIRVKSFNQMLNESTSSLDQEETCYTTF